MSTTLSQPYRNFLTVLIIGLFGLVMTQCQTNSKSGDKMETDKVVLQDENREDLKAEIQKKIDKIDQEIERIDAEIESSAEEAQQKIRQEWETTRAKLIDWRNDLQAELDRSAEVSRENWAEFKSDVKENMQEVEEAFETFGAKMKDAFTTEG